MMNRSDNNNDNIDMDNTTMYRLEKRDNQSEYESPISYESTDGDDAIKPDRHPTGYCSD